MACGVGACLGCIVKGSKKQFKVCQDGPVFGQTMFWGILILI